MSTSGVVYKLNCSDCLEFYVGMIMRRLHQKLKEHAKFDESALNEHSIVCDHNIIKFNCLSILDSDKIR